MIAYIDSIALQAPGLEGWEASRETLKSGQTPSFQPLSKYAPSFLPANERRRTTATIKLALRTAEECAASYSDDEISAMPTLFASVDGDTEISAKMMAAILDDDPMISPIHFHNSVHNAPAGYWMIGKQNRQAASAVSAGDFQLANSFIESLTQLDEIQPRMLLVFYDSPIDSFIVPQAPDRHPFAFALVLSLTPCARSLAKLRLSIQSEAPSPKTTTPYGDNRAADILPLLRSMAKQEKGRLTVPLSRTQSVRLELNPL